MDIDRLHDNIANPRCGRGGGKTFAMLQVMLGDAHFPTERYVHYIFTRNMEYAGMLAREFLDMCRAYGLETRLKHRTIVHVGERRYIFMSADYHRLRVGMAGVMVASYDEDEPVLGREMRDEVHMRMMYYDRDPL